MIPGIQALRAVAALLVLVQHVVVYACLHTGADYLPFLPLPFGSLGVSIFFVLSGFVMSLCVGQGVQFLPRRALRIYPVFWFTVVLSAIIVPLIGREWNVDLVSLLLLPTSTLNQTYLIPYWTLVYEVFFYAVFAIGVLLRLSPRVFSIALATWGLAIIVASVSGVVPPDELVVAAPGAWIALSPPNLLFIIGAIVGLVGRPMLAEMSSGTVMLGAIGLFAISQLSAWSSVVDNLLLGAAVACAIEGARRWSPPAWLVRIGDWSYGLYLAHVIGVLAALRLLEIVAPDARLLVVGAVALVGGAAFGMAVGAIDHAVYRRLLKPAFDRRFGHARREKEPVARV